MKNRLFKIIAWIIKHYIYILYTINLILFIVCLGYSICENNIKATYGWAISSLLMIEIIQNKYKIDKLSKELQDAIQDLINKLQESLNKRP